jgi:hypothetical protein
MFKEVKGDAWDFHAQGAMLCITTNGSIHKKHMGDKDPIRVVTGAGIAQQATERFPSFPWEVGGKIAEYGNHVFLCKNHLISFPVKHEWHEIATLDLIRRSMEELLKLVLVYDFENIILPRPGCGNGQRVYETEVRPILEYYANYWGDYADRFTIISDLSVERGVRE